MICPIMVELDVWGTVQVPDPAPPTLKLAFRDLFNTRTIMGVRPAVSPMPSYEIRDYYRCSIITNGNQRFMYLPL